MERRDLRAMNDVDFPVGRVLEGIEARMPSACPSR